MDSAAAVIAALALLLVGCHQGTSSRSALDAGTGLPVRSCDTVLRFAPPKPIIQAYAVGEWNDFSPAADKLRLQSDGAYSVSLSLPPGEYAYKLVVDGQFQLDPANPWQKYLGGVLNSALRVDDCQAPLLSVASWTVAGGTLDAALQITDGASQHGIDASGLAATLDGAPLHPAAFNPDGSVSLHAAGLAEGKHVARVAFADRQSVPARDLYLPLWVEAAPFLWQDAVLYFALVDRFSDGDPANDHPVAGVETPANFQGGDFAGLTAKIRAGWFDQLGVRALWISNPQAQPLGAWPGADGHQYAGYHGYWPASDAQVDARFGTAAELSALVDAAHARGIRVLLDFVANHVHQDHPWWAQHPPPDTFFNPLHLADGRTCICGAGCSYDPPEGLSCWFTSYLPDINYTDQRAVLAVEQEAVDWMEQFGFDGLRVDAVKQFPHIVGTRLRARLHEALEASGVSTYLVGETFTGSWSSGGQDLVKQYVSPTELHGQFDFPLYWELRSALAEDSAQGFVPLEAALAGEQGFYGESALMSPFLGNHDLPRFLSVAAGQDVSNPWNGPPDPTDPAPYAKEQLAFTLLFTIPGVPLVYQGDDVAMPGAGDPDNRRLMRFDGLSSLAQGVLGRVRALGQLRAQDAALRRGGYRTLLVDSEVLVYARQLAAAKARIVALNRNAAPQTRTVQLTPDQRLPDGTQLTDALGGPQVAPSGGTLSISLPGRGAAVYLPAD